MFCSMARASVGMPNFYKTYRFLHVFRKSPLLRTSRFTQVVECANRIKKQWKNGLEQAIFLRKKKIRVVLGLLRIVFWFW